MHIGPWCQISQPLRLSAQEEKTVEQAEEEHGGPLHLPPPAAAPIADVQPDAAQPVAAQPDAQRPVDLVTPVDVNGNLLLEARRQHVLIPPCCAQSISMQ